MNKLPEKVPKKIFTNEDFKREFHDCVWSDLYEPSEFEELWLGIMKRYELVDVEWFKTMFAIREYWIPAYFRDFPLGSLIRTTSVSETENSFYKSFLKPRSNLFEFYMSFNNALESQRNANARLDYYDSSIVPTLATHLSFEKHASTMYTDSIFRKVQEEIIEASSKCRVDDISKVDSLELYTIKDTRRSTWIVKCDMNEDSYQCGCKLFGRLGILCSHILCVFKNKDVKFIPEKYYEGRWLKTSLAKAAHGYSGDELDNMVSVNPKQNVINKLYSLFYGFLRKFEGNPDALNTFASGIAEVGGKISCEDASTMQKMDDYYGITRPDVIEVHPPKVVKTKGSGKRLVSQREKTIKEFNRPL